MKITGPGSGAPPDAVEGITPSGGSGVAGEAAQSGKVFAEALEPARAGRADSRLALTEDIVADLRAGKLTPGAALEKVVERVVTRQLGADAPAPDRERLRTVLQDAIEMDPLLVQKVRELAGSDPKGGQG